jgi:hypothetical protein
MKLLCERNWSRAALAAALALPAALSAQTPEQLEFFESKVRPVLIENCYKCHSATGEKIKGGLTLDTKEGLLKGGSSGPAIVAGNAERSLLIKAIRYTDPNLQMPPKDRLAEGQVADLEAWVKMGAPDPRSGKQAGILKTASDRDKAKSHWAFQPVRKPPVPTTRSIQLKRWAQTPIDHFILGKMDEKGLLPSMPADRYTLIRRAYFDLTGLPPSPEDVENFIRDESPEAFSKVVDNLLNSQQYGERWARYWLDIARYADTRGANNNNNRMDNEFVFSHTYRDYVVNAFNEDLPYDQFITQQLAADKLASGSNKKMLAAMGFLTLGRQGNLQEVINDRIDVVTRGTMGLSVYCAQCHDHKFDPIPTADYYSLYGVFASCQEPAEKPVIEAPDTQSKDYAEYTLRHQTIEAQLEAFRKGQIETFLTTARERTADYMYAAWSLEKADKRIRDRGDQDEFAKQTKLNPFMAQRWQGYLSQRGNVNDRIFGPWAEYAKLKESEFATRGKELAARYAANNERGKIINPVVAKAFSLPPSTMYMVADRYSKLFQDADKAWQSTLSVYEKKKASGKDDSTAPRGLPDAAQEELRKVFHASPLAVDYNTLAGINNNQIRRREDKYTQELIDLDMKHPGSPARALVLVDRPNPSNAKIMIKGSRDNLGPEVPRRFLEIVGGPNRKAFTQGSGRLELAKAIVSPENPLTSRVIVNRVWQNHFGYGIVRTPSDFGLRAEDPTHPELLDFLASWLVENGWSLKKLHRMIMLSSVYQQSTDENPQYTLVDPSNLYLWRMHRRRLDFEAFRDSLLAVSGKLNLTMGGVAGDLDNDPYRWRRTIYGKIDRRNLPGMYRIFDFASPDATVGQRFNSTVPQQALFMMNSTFILDLARGLVDRTNIKDDQISEEQRIESMYKIAYQRPPSPVEIKVGKRFLELQSGMKSEPTDAPIWRYGWGEYDERAKRIRSFAEFTYFDTKARAWQGSSKMPDARLGSLMEDATGGRPGANHQHSVIRRWTAPRDGWVSIDGALEHRGRDGDGVQGYILSCRTGELGRYSSSKTKVDTKVVRTEVKKGDTIDFIVDPKAKAGNDEFTWAPVIKVTTPPSNLSPGMQALMPVPAAPAAQQMGAMAAPGANATEWRAQADFTRQRPAAPPKPFGTWEKYAQILLLSNELTFVD